MTRSPRRFVAPLALAAVAATATVVVANGTGGGAAKKPPTTSSLTAHRARPLHHTYRVRAGDSLSAIAARTGVTVGQLEQLNPTLDPSALRPGQRIRLRR